VIHKQHIMLYFCYAENDLPSCGRFVEVSGMT